MYWNHLNSSRVAHVPEWSIRKNNQARCREGGSKSQASQKGACYSQPGIKVKGLRDFLAVYWLIFCASSAGFAGSIPRWGTNIPHAWTVAKIN